MLMPSTPLAYPQVVSRCFASFRVVYFAVSAGHRAFVAGSIPGSSTEKQQVRDRAPNTTPVACRIFVIGSLLSTLEPWVMTGAPGETEYCTPYSSQRSQPRLAMSTRSGPGMAARIGPAVRCPFSVNLGSAEAKSHHYHCAQRRNVDLAVGRWGSCQQSVHVRDWDGLA
jgi:hypothetical protein